ncbi:hypothetical protein B9T31_12325 [Acinetobacter sp. ANC 4558]|uniref:fimbrial protein n=1 Tax=Acinetobacter sp. ANC 4558 TaxID=1977876 RepID=UPI000A358494|nr:fimbrial protein [Acinetobacter sp. ANC 4558]OTG85261.1 hypothetical protein B9T31_12325 [Acinetobacter sp. ANC 4558]
MNIKKLFITCCVLYTSALYADPVVKVNLRFKAMIIDRSCTVSSESQNINVALGRWGTKNMTDIGDQTRPISFIINLSDCSATNVSLSFKGQKDLSNPQLLALSNESTAGNVAIQILDQDRKLLPLETSTRPIIVGSSKNLQLSFFANYIATRKNVTAGTADSIANFVLNYD